MLKKALLFLLLGPVLYAGFDYTLSNTNFTISQGSLIPDEQRRYLYNYDRLRFRGDYVQEHFFTTLIADGVNYLGHDYTASASFSYVNASRSDTPFKTQTALHDYYEGALYAKLYRAYGGYDDGRDRIVLGLQNISMGVGRIWTPTNLFNPKNSFALEPDETFGVAAAVYTRHLGETSDLSVIASQKADESLKYAASYKAFLDFADVGVNFISSDETMMAGYELEGNLADTGIELRSEGAYIKSSLQGLKGKYDEEFFQGIIGADYGFENGVVIAAEALYSSQKFGHEEILLNLDSDIFSDLLYSHLYAGVTLAYTLNIFLDASVLYIESFNEKNSRLISPSLTYTLNENHAFVIGAMIHEGERGSEFGALQNTYYLKYALSF